MIHPGQAGVWVRQRQIAAVGVAVRDWVTWHGAVLNVTTDLVPFRDIRTGEAEEPMTSLARERHGPLRMALVRERLLVHFQSVFGLPSPSILFAHPLVAAKRVPAASPF
jgi:lipoate-protein ligase B